MIYICITLINLAQLSISFTWVRPEFTKKSTHMPHIEGDAEDVKSRHKGKLETESYLKQIGIPFTSIRPVYIYGPMNYNPLEEYFFARLHAGRPVCIPGHGQHITGLGHVEDRKHLVLCFIYIVYIEYKF